MRWMLALVVVYPAVAVADDQPPPPADAVHGPGFVTLDRQDAASRAGAQFSYLFPNDSSGSSIRSVRLDFHGQWVDPASGAGGYAQLPISYLSDSGGGSSNSATGIGDVELGAIYVPKLTSPDTGLIIHAGLALPTASTDMDKLFANLAGVYHRFTDYFLFIPKGFSFRAGVSPTIRSGQMFARIDGGVDANISAYMNADIPTVLHFNAGGGIDTGQFAVMAEVTNLYVTKDTGGGGGSTGSSWINGGAVSARFQSGSVQPYGAIAFPLDHDSHQVMNAVVILGLDASLR